MVTRDHILAALVLPIAVLLLGAVFLWTVIFTLAGKLPVRKVSIVLVALLVLAVAAFAPRAATTDTERVEVQRPKLLVAEGLPPIPLWTYDLADPDDCAALILDTMLLVRRCHVDGDQISYESMIANAERGVLKNHKPSTISPR